MLFKFTLLVQCFFSLLKHKKTSQKHHLKFSYFKRFSTFPAKSLFLKMVRQTILYCMRVMIKVCRTLASLCSFFLAASRIASYCCRCFCASASDFAGSVLQKNYTLKRYINYSKLQCVFKLIFFNWWLPDILFLVGTAFYNRKTHIFTIF